MQVIKRYACTDWGFVALDVTLPSPFDARQYARVSWNAVYRWQEE
ncbi:hypothetical protein ACF1DV_05205 [Streptomyces achromogenes]